MGRADELLLAVAGPVAGDAVHVLLHQRVLMVLELVLHSLRAFTFNVHPCLLLGLSLIVDGGHVLIGGRGR